MSVSCSEENEECEEGIQSSSSSPIHSQDPSKACRYCFEPAGEETQMLEPCSCKGSMAYAHPSCLKKWLAEVPKLQDPFSLEDELFHPEIPFSGPNCEICRSKFDSSLSLIKNARKELYARPPTWIFVCRNAQVNGTRAVILFWLLLLTLGLSLTLSLVFLVGTFTGSLPKLTDKAIEIAICITFGIFWLAFCGGCYHLYRYR